MFGTVPPASTFAVAGLTEIEIDKTVMVAVAVLVESVKDVAVTVTVRSLAGGLAGGLYVTELLFAPVRVPAPDAGDIDHETPAPVGSLFTAAAIGKEFPAPTCTVAVAGLTESVIASTVIFKELDLEPSATEVALSVTVKSLVGGTLGAV